jgi:hypothetical protein
MSFAIPMGFSSDAHEMNSVLSYHNYDYRTPFQKAIDEHQYLAAVQIINLNPYTHEKGPIDDPEYRRALIDNAVPSSLLRIAVDNSSYPELMDAFLKTRDMNSYDPNLDNAIQDLIYDSDDKTGDVYRLTMKLMVDNGLNPNKQINGEPMFIMAFKAHNYSLMQQLLQNPNFVILPEYLEIVNNGMAPLDQMRETMLSRLRPASLGVSKKRMRSRYDPDE